MDYCQLELDNFEKQVLNIIFGGDYENNTIFKFIKVVKPQIINDKIEKFETLVKPFMKENGMIDGVMLKGAINLKAPKYAQIVPEKDFLLSSILSDIKNII